MRRLSVPYTINFNSVFNKSGGKKANVYIFEQGSSGGEGLYVCIVEEVDQNK